MLRHPLPALLLLAVTAPLGSAHAADAPDGKALYEKNCLSCHDSSVYTRSDRKVTSRDGLTRQVRRCELALGLRWFDEEIDAVAAHLNRNFYKLP